MATHTTTAPGNRLEAKAQTRRDALTAVGFVGLAAAAAAAISRPETLRASESRTPSEDATILAACVAFQAATAEQERSNAEPGWDDDEIRAIGDRWYHAIEEILTAPAPKTDAGRVALALAARVALVDQVTGNNEVGLGEMASAEEALVLRALDAMREIRA